jgi:hypothetical protein
MSPRTRVNRLAPLWGCHCSPRQFSQWPNLQHHDLMKSSNPKNIYLCRKGKQIAWFRKGKKNKMGKIPTILHSEERLLMGCINKFWQTAKCGLLGKSPLAEQAGKKEVKPNDSLPKEIWPGNLQLAWVHKLYSLLYLSRLNWWNGLLHS